MKAHLSRQALGDMAGVSGKQVGLIERGKVHNPHIETVGNMANALSKVLGQQVDVLDIYPLKRSFKR